MSARRRRRAAFPGVGSILAGLALCGLCSAAGGETVTLQQGAGGYAGCAAKTLWGEKAPKTMTDPGARVLSGQAPAAPNVP